MRAFKCDPLCLGCQQLLLEGLKRCSQCHWPRPLGWYVDNGSSRLRSACRQCMRPKWANDAAKRRARLKAVGAKTTRVTDQVIQEMMVVQSYRCACGCGKSIRWEYHLDHRQPLARGGTHERSNWQLLTPDCNLRKGARHG
jgi:5-methylcytosine-specific restriction endonuclease McrA